MGLSLLEAIGRAVYIITVYDRLFANKRSWLVLMLSKCLSVYEVVAVVAAFAFLRDLAWALI